MVDSQEKDVDLLLVDSGDLHDGTGLSDGYPAGGVDGHEVSLAFRYWYLSNLLAQNPDQQVHVRATL